MTSLPVEEPPSKMVVRLRIKYNRTTIVLNILLISECILKKLVAVAFLGHPVVLKLFCQFLPVEHYHIESIFKGADPKEANHYRGITLNSILAKDYSCSLCLRYVFLVQVPQCKFRFSHPRFLDWEFLSDCAIF